MDARNITNVRNITTGEKNSDKIVMTNPSRSRAPVASVNIVARSVNTDLLAQYAKFGRLSSHFSLFSLSYKSPQNHNPRPIHDPVN